MIAWFLSIFGIQACRTAKVPEDRPTLSFQKLDRKLQGLLQFSVPLIGAEQLFEKQDQMLILDAREPEEYALSHLPNARAVGFKHFEVTQLSDVPKSTPITVYCSVGYRSEKVGEMLQKEGFTKVYNLYGSIFDWAEKGYPLEDQNGKMTTLLHTYNQRWSQLVKNKQVEKKW